MEEDISSDKFSLKTDHPVKKELSFYSIPPSAFIKLFYFWLINMFF